MSATHVPPTFLPTGVYRHYKGGLYVVSGVARHSETEEWLVVYQPQYGDRGLWVRPLDMFTGEVVVEGNSVPRFAYIGPQSSDEVSGSDAAGPRGESAD